MVEKAALLCGGYSITKLWHEDLFDDFGFVGAVNTTGHRYRCHYLFVSDPHLIKPLLDGKCRPPQICVITSRVLGQRLAARKIKSQQFVKIGGGKNGVCCPYTMPNALKFLLERAQTVEVFGMDWTYQRLDFSGQKGDHEINRWIREAFWLQKIWDEKRIIVNGLITPEKLAFIAGRSKKFPGP